METTVAFAALGVVGITIVTEIVKKWIMPKFGATGIHVFVAVLALGYAGVQVAMTTYPGFATFVANVAGYLAGAVAVYEVILKKIVPQTEPDN